MLQTLLLILHVLVALALIGIILIQQGRGATAGAAFGSGASGTVFGARGSATFLSRTTSILAIVFFGNCLLLAWLATTGTAPTSIGQQLETQQKVTQEVQQKIEQATTPSTPVPAPAGDLPQIPNDEPPAPRP